MSQTSCIPIDYWSISCNAACKALRNLEDAELSKVVGVGEFAVMYIETFIHVNPLSMVALHSLRDFIGCVIS